MSYRRFLCSAVISTLVLLPLMKGSAQIVNQLGEAGPSKFTVLSLGGAIQLSGNATVQGNVGIANAGVYSASGSVVVTGTLDLGSHATQANTKTSQIQGGIQLNQDALLNAAASSALNASSSFSQMAVTTSIPGNMVNLSGGKTLTVTGGTGANVLNVGEIKITGGSNLILSAPGGSQFIVNNSGPFQLSGGSNILLQGGLTANDVVFNNASQQVQLSGNSTASGIILAPTADIELQGTLYGEAIGGQRTSITVSGNTHIIGPPTLAQISTAVNAQQVAAGLFQPGVDPTGSLAAVAKLPGVLQTGIAPDGSTIWIDYVGGLEGLISRFPPNTLGGPPTRSLRGSKSSSVKAAFVPKQVLSVGSVSFPSSSDYLGLYPFADSTDASSASVVQQLVSGSCAGPNFITLQNQQVTVDTFASLSSYGVINVFTHGAQDRLGEPVIATRELSTLTTNSLHVLDLAPDPTGHRALLLWNMAGNTSPYFVITPVFFTQHYAPGSLAGAVVLINGCESLAKNDLANAFTGAGASVFLGWTPGNDGKGVAQASATAISENLFTGLTQPIDPDQRTVQVVLGQIDTVDSLYKGQLRAIGAGSSTAICSPYLVLQKTGSGTGTVTSTPSGIDCGPGCTTQTKPFNSPVTLTAVPDQGSSFGGWSGDCAGSDLSTTVQVIAGKTNCTATFGVPVKLTVVMNLLDYQAYPTCLSTPGGCVGAGLFPSGTVVTPDGSINCDEPGLGYTDYAGNPPGLVPAYRACNASYAPGTIVPLSLNLIAYPMGKFPSGGSLTVPCLGSDYMIWQSSDPVTGTVIKTITNTLSTFVTMDRSKVVTLSNGACGI